MHFSYFIYFPNIYIIKRTPDELDEYIYTERKGEMRNKKK